MNEEILGRIETTLRTRRGSPAAESYVASLYAKGIDAILKKIGEEAAETIIAAKGADRAALIHETADLWFHSMVLLAAKDIGVAEVLQELARREGVSGLAEKAARNNQ